MWYVDPAIWNAFCQSGEDDPPFHETISFVNLRFEEI
jgi:hypothetical protein